MIYLTLPFTLNFRNLSKGKAKMSPCYRKVAITSSLNHDAFDLSLIRFNRSA